jgi:hypothetical protein
MSPDIISHPAGAAKVASAVADLANFLQFQEATAFITSRLEANDEWEPACRLQCQLCLSMEDRTMPLACHAYCLPSLSTKDRTMSLTNQVYCQLCLSKKDRTMHRTVIFTKAASKVQFDNVNVPQFKMERAFLWPDGWDTAAIVLARPVQ